MISAAEAALITSSHEMIYSDSDVFSIIDLRSEILTLTVNSSRITRWHLARVPNLSSYSVSLFYSFYYNLVLSVKFVANTSQEQIWLLTDCLQIRITEFLNKIKPKSFHFIFLLGH